MLKHSIVIGLALFALKVNRVNMCCSHSPNKIAVILVTGS
jgi:hypothetical protein